MKLPILNRESKHPADGWYQIEPKGEHPGTNEAGEPVLQIVDDASIASIVSTFNREADAWKAQHGTEFPGMLIDIEHFSHEADKETRAYGWLKRLQNRADGFYGKIDWSGTGKRAVDEKDYLYFSTEYDPEDFRILNREGDKTTIQPMRLSGLSLTNRPNNKGGKPITNRKLSPEETPASHPAGNPQKADIQTKETMKKIATKLGLSAEASEDSILEKIEALIEQATTNQKKEKDEEGLKNRLVELENEQVDGLISEHGLTDAGKIATVKPVLAGLKNRAERVAFLKLVVSDKSETTANGKTPMTVQNRAKTPNGEATGDPKDAKADNARAVRIQNRAAELRGASKGRISLSAAYSQAGAQVDAEIAAGK